MATATITITVDYSAAELATLKELFPNANGSVPTNAEVLANVKTYLSTALKQKYRGFAHNKQTAAISITDLALT